MRLLSIALTLTGLGVAAPGLAQLPLASMTDDPCPKTADPGPPAEMRAMMLQPGARLPAAMEGPGSDAALQDYAKRRTEGLLRDFGNLCRYKAENAAQAQSGRPDVVLLGDSITEGWLFGDPSVFSAQVIDRGIGGQTSSQMVLRFYQDVVALRPKIVHIMAGTNDLAGNTGPNSPEDFKNNIRAMVDLARANGIQIVLASIPPADRFPWRSDVQPAGQVRVLNAWLRDYAQAQGLVFVDYHTALTTPAGALNPDFTNDGVHPTTRGYAVMRPLFEQAIDAALTRSDERR